MQIEFTIELSKSLMKEANRRGEHWTIKKKRHDIQKLLIRSKMNYYLFEEIPRPCIVTMTRIAPRSLDDDNNITFFKWIRDELASSIIDQYKEFRPGQCDNNPCIKWQYKQEKGIPKFYGIKIEIVPKN